jgi:hypothetical protein
MLTSCPMQFTEQECHEALTATSTSHVDDCVGASSTQLDQIANADLPPTNQAARRGHLDKIIAPQRILPTLWRNDVTDTKTHIDNSTQDVCAFEVPWRSSNKSFPCRKLRNLRRMVEALQQLPNTSQVQPLRKSAVNQAHAFG